MKTPPKSRKPHSLSDVVHRALQGTPAYMHDDLKQVALITEWRAGQMCTSPVGSIQRECYIRMRVRGAMMNEARDQRPGSRNEVRPTFEKMPIRTPERLRTSGDMEAQLDARRRLRIYLEMKT